jgi:hypothetical protein
LLPGNLGNYVTEWDDGALGAVNMNILVGNVARQFQLRVVDGSRRVGIRHQVILDGLRKFRTGCCWS